MEKMNDQAKKNNDFNEEMQEKEHATEDKGVRTEKRAAKDVKKSDQECLDIKIVRERYTTPKRTTQDERANQTRQGRNQEQSIQSQRDHRNRTSSQS